MAMGHLASHLVKTWSRPLPLAATFAILSEEKSAVMEVQVSVSHRVRRKVAAGNAALRLRGPALCLDEDEANKRRINAWPAGEGEWGLQKRSGDVDENTGPAWGNKP
jgi:hypothetical protein